MNPHCPVPLTIAFVLAVCSCACGVLVVEDEEVVSDTFLDGNVLIPAVQIEGQTEAFGEESGFFIMNPSTNSYQIEPWLLYVTADPPSGNAPLVTVIRAVGVEHRPYMLWDLDWDADGITDVSGQGEPVIQVTYDTPGSYTPTFTFYSNLSEVTATATGTVVVTGAQGDGQYPTDGGQDENVSDRTGTSSSALTFLPSGGGGIKDGRPPFGNIPTSRLDEGASGGWSPPEERFSEDLDPELNIFPQRGSAPLTVRMDASKTVSRYGVYKYSWDVIWGPDDEEDDGYYEKSGADPMWTRSFEEYGLYKVILDVEDLQGNRARTTEVVAVTDPGLGPVASVTANVTNGTAPLTVLFEVRQDSSATQNPAAFAYWDFDTRDVEEPFGGSLDEYKKVVHTFYGTGTQTVGVTLADESGNAGSMAAIDITASLQLDSP